MKDLEAQIEKYQEQAKELTEVREDLLVMQSEINVAALGGLLNTLNEGIGDLIKQSETKNYYDKDLCKTLSETTAQLVNAFSKLKAPTVTVNPNISVDLKPLQSIAGEISKQNDSLIKLVTKLSNSDNGELQKLVVAMIVKQNVFLEKSFQQTDYTKQLTELIAVFKNQNRQVEEYKVVRNDFGLQSVKLIYK